jgi:hypothetical protein
MGANAQTAVPAFIAGEVLTAAEMTQVNTGIPVFATTTTRDAAFDGAGEKVLAEGQFAYIEATDTTQFYNGTAWSALSPKVLQVVSTTKTDTFTTTSTSFVDITGLSVSITPSSATNKVLVFVNLSVGDDPTVTTSLSQLVRNTTAINIGDTAGSRTPASQSTKAVSTDSQATQAYNFLDSPATTSATTYKVQILTAGATQTTTVNRSKLDNNTTSNARTTSTIVAMEISA